MNDTRRRSVEHDVELNMTPMIDVTFQLLIFFLVTMKFRLLENKLDSYLPTDFGPRPAAPIVEETFLTVRLKQTGPRRGERLTDRATAFYVEGDLVGTSEDPASLDRVARRVFRFRELTRDAKGKIHAEEGVPHRRVVSALDVFHRAGYGTITFTGLTANSEKDPRTWERIRSRLTE